MNYRDVVIEEDIDLSTAGTQPVDIKITDPISALFMKFNLTSQASYPTPLKHPVEAISKVELVDGSEVLEAMTGKQMMAAHYWGTKQNPASYNGMGFSLDAYFTIPMLFGRKLWDRELAFDGTKFDNPQLKITHNLATPEASAAALKYTLMASVFDERKIAPTGFLMRKAVKTVTPVATEHKYFTMPTDYPYRMILIEGYASDNHARRQVKTVKLSEDQDKKIPINMETTKYFWELGSLYPPVRENFNVAVTTGAKTYHSMVTYEKQVMGMSMSAAHLYKTWAAGDQFTLTAASGGYSQEGVVEGTIPFHTFPLLFGDINDIDDFYDVSALGDLELDLLAHSSVGDSPSLTVMTEQLRPY